MVRAIAGTCNAKELPGRPKVLHLEVTAELVFHGQRLGAAFAGNENIIEVENSAKKDTFFAQCIEA